MLSQSPISLFLNEKSTDNFIAHETKTNNNNISPLLWTNTIFKVAEKKQQIILLSYQLSFLKVLRLEGNELILHLFSPSGLTGLSIMALLD